MSRDDATLSAHERLIEALVGDLLGLPEDEVLASHTPSAARVAADTLRRRLRRAASERTGALAPPDVPLGPSAEDRGRPEKKP